LNQEPKHDPLAALRQPSFILYSLSRVGAALGQQLLQTVMLYQVWDISGSALNLGLMGLIRFFPSLAMSFLGGAVADAYDRRIVLICAKAVPLACGVVLAVASIGDWITIELIFGLVVFLGLSASFEGPARIAMLPAVVKPETFENAVTVSNALQKLAAVTGPTIGGLLIGFAGAGSGYAAFCIITVVSILPLTVLRYVNDLGPRQPVSIASMKEGVMFVARRQVLLGAMTLDMFAVIFGGAQALLPIYATDILKVGPEGYGVLSSSMQVGAFAMVFLLIMRKPIQQTGRALIYTVIAFGLLTVAFGLSRDYMLSILLYALIGAADQISVVMRQTTIQMASPDELRGRVSSVNQVFVGASGQIGGIRAGLVASVAGATFAVWTGGLGAVIVALLIAWKMRDLYNYEIPRGEPVRVASAPGLTGPPEASPSANGNGDTVSAAAARADVSKEAASTGGS
jgi:MFS family permease